MPIVKSININENSHVDVWNINEDVSELIEQLKPCESDLAKINSYKLDKRKLEFIATRLIIKNRIGSYPIIDYLESGKPILKNSTYNISITHTKEYAAVIFSTHPNPGIDIEYPSERIMKIWERFISKSESNFIPIHKQKEYYSLIWCIKEAMYKVLDIEGVIFNENLICNPFTISTEGTVTTNYISNSNKKELTFSYIINSDFYLVYSI